jgi:hypothetical protein
VIVSDFLDWWQTVLVRFCSDQLGLATIVSACLDIRLEMAVIPGTTKLVGSGEIRSLLCISGLTGLNLRDTTYILL